jgi:glycosyltransferase involved in cell wall biosynthesis
MNLGPGSFLFAVFGHLRESKRIESVLAAFRQVRQKYPQAALLIAGDFVSAELARVLEEPLKWPGIRRVRFLPEDDFWRYAAAADACINLRYPAAGETSGISTRLMGIGKPVLVTHSEETARIPEGACLRVDAGAAEVDMLARYMSWLVQAPEIAAKIGARAAAHIAAHHSLDRVAELYWRVLGDSR